MLLLSDRGPLACLVVVLTLVVNPLARAAMDKDPGDPSRYDVIWSTPSKSAADSMPIGNGDIGLNVWMEPTGDLLFYIAKTDAVSENGEFLKLGRVRVTFDPPVNPQTNFRQQLHLREGLITIENGSAESNRKLRIWVDANHPEIHIDAIDAKPFGIRAAVELWRNQPRILDMKGSTRMDAESFGMRELRGGPPVIVDPDTVLPAEQSQITWMHRNVRSIYPEVLHGLHLDSLLSKYPDPILNRTFGCLMRGPGLVADGDTAIHSRESASQHHITITCLTEQTPTADNWRRDIAQLAAADDALPADQTYSAHARWWNQFWQRSWINVTGAPDAEKVASGYALQRWMMACDARGPLPVKYNGGLFTVGRTFTDPNDKSRKIEYPDWRAWGSNYWFQNNRHLYWPLIPAGDFDLLQPFFDMYVHDLPLITDKTRLYWHHGGAAFQETIYFFGLPNLTDFGWNNSSTEMQNTWIRWYWSGGIEMTAMMLARYRYTQDDNFARQTLLPFADAITTFYNEHWNRGPDGKILFQPAQSLETYQQGVVNPLPEIAGLRDIVPQLLQLPKNLTTSQQRDRWNTMLADLPPIPIGADKDGKPVLLPAQKYGKPRNVENTQLYALYPYHLYGIGLPDLDLARRTFDQRPFPGTKCWSQDPIDEALLGLTDAAQRDVIINFTNSGARFQAFWKPEHDWQPDFDNGGAASQALQDMLLQCVGDKIQLLPAWPANWDADFKLLAPMQTTITAAVRGGRLVNLQVSPPSRKADVIVLGLPARN